MSIVCIAYLHYVFTCHCSPPNFVCTLCLSSIICVYSWRVSSQNGLYPLLSIWDKLLICKGNKKMCDNFDHNFRNISLYINELCVIRNALFCTIRWYPYFKKFQKWRLTRFAMKIFNKILFAPSAILLVCEWRCRIHHYSLYLSTRAAQSIFSRALSRSWWCPPVLSFHFWSSSKYSFLISGFFACIRAYTEYGNRSCMAREGKLSGGRSPANLSRWTSATFSSVFLWRVRKKKNSDWRSRRRKMEEISSQRNLSH